MDDEVSFRYPANFQHLNWVGGGFNPFPKNIRQKRNLPHVGVKLKNMKSRPSSPLLETTTPQK